MSVWAVTGIDGVPLALVRASGRRPEHGQRRHRPCWLEGSSGDTASGHEASERADDHGSDQAHRKLSEPDRRRMQRALTRAAHEIVPELPAIERLAVGALRP